MKILTTLVLVAAIVALPSISRAGTVQFYCHTVLAPQQIAGDKNNDRVSIYQATFAPGYTGSAHKRKGTSFIVVDRGTATVTIQGKPPQRVAAGSSMTIPAGAIHTVANLSKSDGLDIDVVDIGASKVNSYVHQDKKPRHGCGDKPRV